MFFIIPLDIHIFLKILINNLGPRACWLSDSLGDTEQSYNYVFTLFGAIQGIGNPIRSGYDVGHLFFDFCPLIIAFGVGYIIKELAGN